MKRKFAATLVLAVLAGCASAPAPRYYTLDMRASGQAEAPVNILVGHIRVAEALGRKNILIQKNPTEVEYYALDEWVAGLDELIRLKLEGEFGPYREERPSVKIDVSVLAFEQVDSGLGAEASVSLAVTFYEQGQDASGTPAPERRYDIREAAAGANAAEVVRTLSRGIETAALRIAADTAAL